MIYLIATIIVVLLLSLILAGMYNNLVALKLKVDNSWKVIEKKTNEKYNLVFNLLQISKDDMQYEKDTIINIENLINKYFSLNDTFEKSSCYISINNEIKSLFTLIEAYPELKLNKNFIKIQEKLNTIENDMINSIQMYNDAIHLYNTSILSFPEKFVAKFFGFKEMAFFNVNEKK